MKSDLFMNDLAERLLGYSAKDVLTMFCNGKLQTRTSQCPTMKVTDPQTRLLLWWIVAPEDMEEQMRLEMMVMLGLEEEASARIRVRTKDGRSVPCIENARQVRDVHRLEPGVIASIFFTFTPIPEP
jgi:PAS domain-containing protein